MMKALGVYVAGSWAIIQVIDVLAQNLGLPSWAFGYALVLLAIGLPIVLAIGIDGFKRLLHGAWEMDTHFRQAPMTQNLPVTLALLGVWYVNFFAAEMGEGCSENVALVSQHLAVEIRTQLVQQFG